MAGVMLSNAGRMVPAMAMITSSVPPHRRGGFLGATAAVQHVASGLGSSVAGAILTSGADDRLIGYPTVGLIGAAATLASLWLAGRLRVAAPEMPIGAEGAVAAAACGETDAAEPLAAFEAMS
jgi:MFS family permease